LVELRRVEGLPEEGLVSVELVGFDSFSTERISKVPSVVRFGVELE
jgi:hypothetical protein